MYSLRIEAQQRKEAVVNLDSRVEFPALGASSEIETQDSADGVGVADLGADLGWEADAVEFSAGNPRVEHIVGVVHLYREQHLLNSQAGTSAHTARASSSHTPVQGHPHLPAERGPVLCCLAIPADMSMADFCGWCGAYLSSVRSMRVLRREAKQRVVCMVLMRFSEQAYADQFYEDFNLKPFSSLEPEVICRLVYVQDVQILTPRHPAHASSSKATSSSHAHAHPAAQQLSISPQASISQAAHSSSAAREGEATTSSAPHIPVSPKVDDFGRSPRNLSSLLMLHHSNGGAPGGSRSNKPSRSGTPRAGTPRAGTPRRLSVEGKAGLGGDGGQQVDAWDRLPPGHLGTELPTCPVCLERLDEHISGVVITVCNHQFHSDCLKKWGDTSCPVCRYCTQANAHSSRCAVCNATHDLWICLICGNVGCGRYKAGHASDHWKSSSHCYALELETQRVWDYAGDNYVHRLIQSKTDGKLVEVPTPGHRRRHRHSHSHRHSTSSLRGVRCGAGPGGSEEMDEYEEYDEPSEWEGERDDEMKEALFASKLDHIADEYNHLLTSQLDSQRAYYEGLLAQQATTLTHRLSLAEAATATHQTAMAAVDAACKEAERKRQALERKLADMTAAHARAVEERGFLQSLNDTLLANQKELRQQVEAQKALVVERDTTITDLQEQVRDLMVFIEAGRVIQSSSELQDATVLAGPSPAPAAGSSRGKGRSGARRAR